MWSRLLHSSYYHISYSSYYQNMCVIQSHYRYVAIGHHTMSSAKANLCEVGGHFTIPDFCEAYGCFIVPLLV